MASINDSLDFTGKSAENSILLNNADSSPESTTYKVEEVSPRVYRKLFDDSYDASTRTTLSGRIVTFDRLDDLDISPVPKSTFIDMGGCVFEQPDKKVADMEKKYSPSSFESPKKYSDDSITKAVALMSVTDSPCIEDKTIITAGFDALERLATPERKIQAHNVSRQIIGRLDPHEVSTLDYHQGASAALSDSGGMSESGIGYLSKLASMAQETPPRVINIDHMTKLQKTGGFHLITDSTKYDIDEIAKNPKTGVVFACVDGKKKSSLFPSGTTEKEIIQFACHAHKIASHDNRVLRKTDKGFAIECFGKSKGLVISSVFPVFSYEEFEPHDYELTPGVTVSSEEILKAANQMLEKDSDYYEIIDPKSSKKVISVIVDVASKFSDRTRVKNGILFKFDQDAFPKLFDWMIKEDRFEGYRPK